MKETLQFLHDLKNNNNRDWFASRRPLYEHALEYRSRLTDKLLRAVAEVDPRAGTLAERDCTYRIYRDTRFSSDKTPYKTHIGIFINPPYGKKSPLGGYYFHLEPDKCMIAAGNVCHPPKVLSAIRRSIADNIEEYDDLMRDARFRAVFPVVGDNLLKTVPKGFARDWPFAAYVRPRDFVATTTEAATPEPWIDDPDVLRNVIEQAYRFNKFINYAIAEALGMDL